MTFVYLDGMGDQQLTQYLDRHCHFRFRGGKQAYGVIWETENGLVFSSKELHDRFRKDQSNVHADDLLFIDRDDVILAEVID